MPSYVNEPALTYTLEDFIKMKNQDNLTYINFTILRESDTSKIKYVEQNIIDLYMPELKRICVRVEEITSEQIAKYKYAPDMLAYDIYGSVQLDFIVLLCNGIIDSKEFAMNRAYLTLPRPSVLNQFLSEVYNSESNWITTNRTELGENIVI